MTQPHQPSGEPPAATVVEWGPDRPPDPEGAAARWRDPRVGWVLAGLGGVALFASLVGEWRVTHVVDDAAETPSEVTDELAAFGTWGTAWVVGGMVLATCAVLALAGQPALRPYARTVGLAVAGAQLGVLVAATIAIGDQSAPDYLAFANIDPPDYQTSLGRGVYAAYAAVALVAAALWLSRAAWVPPPADAPPTTTAPPVRAGPPPAEPVVGDPEPGEITVGPAEPIAYPDERHEWR